MDTTVMKWKPNTPIKVISSKSIHAGQSGTVVADYGQYIMVLADDPTYTHAARNSIVPKDSPNRYFFVDTLSIKEIKQ